MEKTIGEEDIKRLEGEIESAVDRLFVEKNRNVAKSLPVEPPTPEPSYDPVKTLHPEPSLHPSHEPLPYIKSFEKMETQLLSLEWEITKGNLEKTKEEVLTLRELLKERPDITSVLNLMEKTLTHMIHNEENIHPPQIKFLLDAEETVKLLMRKETEGEIKIYKQLAFGGIEARFLSLEGLRETRSKRLSLDESEDRNRAEIFKVWEKQMEGLLNKINLFSAKVDETLKKFEQHLSRLSQKPLKPPEELLKKRPLPMEITIFKIDEKMFGIESHKVLKLFKVPNTFQDKYFSQQKIRLKDFEIKMVDLKKIFSIEDRVRKGLPAGRQGEIQILTVKENGEYKGLVVDQVFKKLSTEADISGEYGEYFLGMVHWTYQAQPVEIPILNLKKI